jgi:DivIVA domain-containing protein
MLTPQAIKDQEFQIKFRGYDAIEVRAYLELLADDYFELSELSRAQIEQVEALREEIDTLRKDNEAVKAELDSSTESAARIRAEVTDSYKHKDVEIEKLIAQVEALQGEKAADSAEGRKQLEKIAELESQLADGRGDNLEDQAEIERLRARIEILEQQNKELKQEGVDFKTTILAAQKFADNLRETSRLEADKLMEEALLEVEKFRTEAEAELARLPREIEALKRRKQEVREELRGILNSYLSGLDVFNDTTSSGLGDDTSDLYERMELPDLDADGLTDL